MIELNYEKAVTLFPVGTRSEGFYYLKARYSWRWHKLKPKPSKIFKFTISGVHHRGFPGNFPKWSEQLLYRKPLDRYYFYGGPLLPLQYGVTSHTHNLGLHNFSASLKNYGFAPALFSDQRSCFYLAKKVNDRPLLDKVHNTTYCYCKH